MIPVSVFALFSVYELFTVPLYLRIIWVLSTNQQEFKTPFFRMLAVIGACEIAHYVTDVVFYRLPIFGPTAESFGRSPSRWLTLGGPWAVYFFNHPVYFLQVAICVNRLTSVYFPIRNKMWWQKLWLPLVVLAFLCSFCMTAHRLPFNATAQFVPLVDTDPSAGYTPAVVKYDYYFIDQSVVTIAYNSTVLLLCIVINGATFAKIMAMKRAGTLSNSSATSTAELNLFVICVWMMLSMLVVIAYQICNFMARYGLYGTGADMKYALYTVYLFQPLVDDTGSMSHPWLLIFMCGNLRRAVLPFLGKFVCDCRVRRRKNNGVASGGSIRSVPVSVTNVNPTFRGRQLAAVQ